MRGKHWKQKSPRSFSCPLLHMHSLTQKVHISLASAPIPHNLAEGGHKQKKDGPGADMLREKEG